MKLGYNNIKERNSFRGELLQCWNHKIPGVGRKYGKNKFRIYLRIMQIIDPWNRKEYKFKKPINYKIYNQSKLKKKKKQPTTKTQNLRCLPFQLHVMTPHNSLNDLMIHAFLGYMLHLKEWRGFSDRIWHREVLWLRLLAARVCLLLICIARNSLMSYCSNFYFHLFLLLLWPVFQGFLLK